MGELDIKEWIEQAEEDLGTAEYNLKGERYNATVFYSQQAAEKLLKASYIKKFGKLLKIHDVALLAHTLGAPENIIDIQKLSTYYVTSRYPASSDKIKEEDAEDALEMARKVIEWARERM